MSKKLLLVLVDGMRPDAMIACGHPFVSKMQSEGLYSLNVKTVMPSVTLPCHMSLFHSVPPERHGITTNFYMPQVRPIKGLCEVLKSAGKQSAFFYTWHELRDLCRPDSLSISEFINLHNFDNSDNLITEKCISELKKNSIDFAFLYLGNTDSTGHNYGWMSEQQLNVIKNAVNCIQTVYEALSDKYNIIVTADHGGHDRGHGSEHHDDMTIPLFFLGDTKGKLPENCSIMDIAPTILKLLGIENCSEWEGKALFNLID